MQIEIRRGITLQPGTYNAVVAPEKEMVAAINSNTDLQRFLFLYSWERADLADWG
jgi:DNA polymerase I